MFQVLGGSMTVLIAYFFAVLAAFCLGVQVAVTYLEHIGINVIDNVRAALRQHPWLSSTDDDDWGDYGHPKAYGDQVYMMSKAEWDEFVADGTEPDSDFPAGVDPNYASAGTDEYPEDDDIYMPSRSSWDGTPFLDGFCTDVSVIKHLVRRLVEAEDALGVERTQPVYAIQDRIVGKALLGTARLDVLTQEQTTFTSFWDLVNAKGGFRPTLACTALADAYDEAQAGRGDARRAERRYGSGGQFRTVTGPEQGDLEGITYVDREGLTWADLLGGIGEDAKDKDLDEAQRGHCSESDFYGDLPKDADTRPEAREDQLPWWPTHTREQFNAWLVNRAETEEGHSGDLAREEARRIGLAFNWPGVDSGSTTEQASSTDEEVA
jgi:hypothetical protein